MEKITKADRERLIINKAMKDFRKSKDFAKDKGEQINAIFYLGDALSKEQISVIKEAIYGMSEINKAFGKDLGTMLTVNVPKEITKDILR